MIKISALNESENDDDDSGSQEGVVTKEAQEEEAFALYNKALQLLHQGEAGKAERVFGQLLATQFISESKTPKEGEGLVRPCHLLKYSAYKNMASIAAQQNKFHRAMECYLEAVAIDSSDVTVWYKIGSLSVKIHNYPLASYAFQEGLRCNPNHWPCLDNAISVIYALNDYVGCLYYIAQALDKESYYIKGHAIRDQIFKEQPSLRRDCLDLFVNCESLVQTAVYDREEGDKYIEECWDIRRIRREHAKQPPMPVVAFLRPWIYNSWKFLGECLIELYDNIGHGGMAGTYSSRVDLSGCIGKTDLPPPPASSSSSGQNLLCTAEGPAPDIPTVDQPLLLTVMQMADSAGIQETIDAEENQENFLGSADGGFLEGLGMNKRRGRKRKQLEVDISDFALKRRSARVRNTARKQQESIDFFAELQKFLPW